MASRSAYLLPRAVAHHPAYEDVLIADAPWPPGQSVPDTIVSRSYVEGETLMPGVRLEVWGDIRLTDVRDPRGRASVAIAAEHWAVAATALVRAAACADALLDGEWDTPADRLPLGPLHSITLPPTMRLAAGIWAEQNGALTEHAPGSTLGAPLGFWLARPMLVASADRAAADTAPLMTSECARAIAADLRAMAQTGLSPKQALFALQQSKVVPQLAAVDEIAVDSSLSQTLGRRRDTTA